MQEPLQQVQSILKKRSMEVISSLGNIYPRQGQVLPLAGVAQVVMHGEATRVRPADGWCQVSLCQLHLRLHRGPVSH